MKLAMRRVSGLYDEMIRMLSRPGVSCERTNKGANSMQKHSSTQPGLITLFRFIDSFLPPGGNGPFPDFPPEGTARKIIISGLSSPTFVLQQHLMKSTFWKTEQGDWHKNTKNFGNNPLTDKNLSKQTVFVGLSLRNC